MHNRTLICTFFLTLIATSATAQDGPPPAAVEVTKAAMQPMVSVVLAPGTVVSRNDARIAAEFPGRLNWIAEVGEEIAEGEVIARIDDTALKLQLQDDLATIRRLEASLTYMRQQVGRLEQLANDNVAARDQLDEARSRATMAEQDLVAAEVARQQTLHRIERSEIRAPFSGRIVERIRQAGEYIPVGGEVARLVDTDNVEVVARAPMVVAPYVEAGTMVTLRREEREVVSSVRTVIPVGDDRSRLIEVRVTLDETGWVIGAPVRVALPKNNASTVVAVPRDALILRQDNVYLFKVTDEGTVEQVAVRTGVGNGRMIEVQGDVRPGDRIVVRGGERLQPGQAVTIASDG